MNVLKPYIAIAIANALLLVFMVGFGPSVKQLVLGASSIATPTPMDFLPTIAPTTLPKRRIVRVFVTATPKAMQSVRVVPSNNTATVAPSPPPPVGDSRCLIKIDGATFDVTAFRSAHSGGNVFTCGGDMSQIFWSKHGQRMLDYMARFKI